jgi:hypothetical protein
MSKDKVGYGNPPKEFQFPKGKSGNAMGRPKGSRNINSIVKEVYFQPVNVTLNGKTKKVPLIEALHIKLASIALGSDVKAIKLALDAFERHIASAGPGSVADLIAGQSPFELTAEDEANIAKHKLLKGIK